MRDPHTRELYVLASGMIRSTHPIRLMPPWLVLGCNNCSETELDFVNVTKLPCVLHYQRPGA